MLVGMLCILFPHASKSRVVAEWRNAWKLMRVIVVTSCRHAALTGIAPGGPKEDAIDFAAFRTIAGQETCAVRNTV
jgi:hypothetical protein